MIGTMGHPIGRVTARHSQPCLEGDRMARVKRTVIERVMEKIVADDRGYLTPCWIFKGSISNKGYGTINSGVRAIPMLAHRATYEHHLGTIPAGLELDHLCRQVDCCNPDHLDAVTHAENVRRGRATGRSHAKKVCKHGHEMTPENTRLGNRNGWQIRRCRACNREYACASRS